MDWWVYSRLTGDVHEIVSKAGLCDAVVFFDLLFVEEISQKHCKG